MCIQYQLIYFSCHVYNMHISSGNYEKSKAENDVKFLFGELAEVTKRLHRNSKRVALMNKLPVKWSALVRKNLI